MAGRRLSLEEQEALEELLAHEGVAALLKEAEALVYNFSHKVLTFDLSSQDAVQLTYAKCRADGARQMFEALKSRIASLKQKQRDGASRK